MFLKAKYLLIIITALSLLPIGCGYKRFIIHDQLTRRPISHATYKVCVQRRPIKKDRCDETIFGIADAAGRTQKVKHKSGTKYQVDEFVSFDGSDIEDVEYDRSFNLVYEGTDRPCAQCRYQIKVGKKIVTEGYSDDLGNTKIVGGKKPATLMIEVFNE